MCVYIILVIWVRFESPKESCWLDPLQPYSSRTLLCFYIPPGEHHARYHEVLIIIILLFIIILMTLIMESMKTATGLPSAAGAYDKYVFCSYIHTYIHTYIHAYIHTEDRDGLALRGREVRREGLL